MKTTKNEMEMLQRSAEVATPTLTLDPDERTIDMSFMEPALGRWMSHQPRQLSSKLLVV